MLVFNHTVAFVNHQVSMDGVCAECIGKIFLEREFFEGLHGLYHVIYLRLGQPSWDRSGQN